MRKFALPKEMNAIFFLALTVFLLHHAEGDSEATLSIAVFISGSGQSTGGTDAGRPFVKAVDLAVELINNDTMLLPGFNLEYEVTDSQVRLSGRAVLESNKLTMYLPLPVAIYQICSII